MEELGHGKYWAMVPGDLASAARRVLYYSSAIDFDGTLRPDNFYSEIFLPK